MMAEKSIRTELQKIEHALVSLQGLTGAAGEAARQPLLARKAELEAELSGSGAIAQGDGAAIGERGVDIQENMSDSALTTGDHNLVIQNSTIIVNKEGARKITGEEAVKMTRDLRGSDLGRYLEYMIAHNRYLQLQGIRSGGKLVSIELEEIYVRLRAMRQRTVQAEELLLAQEASLAPGEKRRIHDEGQTSKETVTVNVEEALADHRHLVILGDPGSGKTTLLRYLALLYGRDLAEKKKSVKTKLKLDESGYLPILLPLRQIGQFLKAHHGQNDGTDGHALLLDFLLQTLVHQKVALASQHFEDALRDGKAVVLLDGMDEVADPDLRARVARLIEDFTLAYPDARFVVTSRVVGYSGAARLGGDYAITTVRDFSLDDVRQFLRHWHRLVAVGQMGAVESAQTFAASQTEQLMSAIEANERVQELAINPLMLTVIALVHRDRVKLPDRRAELYAEAVDVLLGKWDEARGVKESKILPDRPFDAGDRRLLLQRLALQMHEANKKEIENGELQAFLLKAFSGMTHTESDARRAAERFLKVIEERTGLLSARGEGIYAFSHLTFQEYLAALAIVARDDYIAYVLARSGEPWWKEVILLTAGEMSTQSTERTSKLLSALAKKKKEPTPYHNLVLASECLRDAGETRVDGEISTYIEEELQKNLRKPMPVTARMLGKWGGLRGWVERRAEVLQALTRAGGGYWSGPYGEPEWVNIPAGKFWMGGNGKYDRKPIHKVNLPTYQIAKAPITNYQYSLFVKATKHKAPSHFDGNRPPKGLESHPVVNVDWYDAIAYCEWLSKVTGKRITLPSEAEWEKAAHGDKDKRAYPWGDAFDKTRCNSVELGLGGTTPVGIFLEGESPFGVLDLSGNVWEWTRSIHKSYPYFANDGRENLDSDSPRVLRGGAFFDFQVDLRCACRSGLDPDLRDFDLGFRLVVSPSSSV